jgi:hypothetical protein
MSHQNVELLRRAVDAYNTRDIDEFVAHCDPSIEFQSAFSAVGGEVYFGHDGVANGIAISRGYGETTSA